MIDPKCIAAKLAAPHRLRWAEVAFWSLAAASLFFPAHHLLATEIIILALFALSLDLVLGFAGILTLGHGAFFGLGAYVAGLVAIHMTGEPLSGLILAAMASAVLGAVMGPLLTRRAADLSRLMVTLGIAMLLAEAANSARFLTGGDNGLDGILIDPIFGLWEFDLMGRTGHAYTLAVMFVLFVAARVVMASHFGLSLRAIRDNALRAEAMGIPVARRLTMVHALGAAYAGVAGALLAQTTMFVSLDVLAFHRSAEVLLMLVIGGAGWLYGGLIGAIAFEVLQTVLSNLTPQYWQFWMGAIFVALVLIGRGRLGAMFGARR